MPRYLPNSRFSDAWSSAGNVTFYHRGGLCYWRARTRPGFPATAGQLEHMELHRRALAAWKDLDQSTQERWNLCAAPVVSHRPPFDGTGHITGHNLFVSAYHGFAQIGAEHVPEPMPWEDFPTLWLSFHDVVRVGEDSLQLRFRARLGPGKDPERYRLHVKLQFTEPGKGRNGGQLKTFLADDNCTGSDCIVPVTIPCYRTLWNLDLPAYQVHCRYLLIDTATGYRNIFKRKSFLLAIPK